MSSPEDPRSWLVAHRGHASQYPENTLSAMVSAATVGLELIEFDVQLTADLQPVVLHDASLRRTAGRDRRIFELRARDIERINAGYADRFGDRFAVEPLPLLSQVVRFFATRPALTPIVEIKPESVRALGEEAAVDAVMTVLGPILSRCVVISFDRGVVAAARRRGAPAVGWCLNRYEAETRAAARDLVPDYLLVNHRRLPPDGEAPWPGPWEWMSWEVADVGLARQLRQRGVRYIETMAGAELLAELS